jgi:uncharacterized protein
MAKNALKVNAFEMLRRPGTIKSIRIDVDPTFLDVDDSRVVAGSEVEIDLICESLSDGIVVRGLVGASFHGECRRCLKPLVGRIDADVNELYQLTVTDPDAFPIEGDQIDLGPMVRETVLLELPDAPLCTFDCAGLCATCGRDLNEVGCSCPREDIDPRWSVLDALRDRLPE